MKTAIGRPTIMTPKTLTKLREAFLMGCTDKEACIYSKIAESTLYTYQQEHKEFSEQKELWKVNPVLEARKTIFDNLDNIGVAKWFLERKARTEFNSTTKEHSEEPLEPMRVIFVDEDED